MEICQICGKEFDKSKRRFQSIYNLCSNRCKYEFLGSINRKHNLAHKTNLYGIWKALRQRCTNPKDKGYKNYGARGIIFCDEWNDFENFYKWSIENGYKYEPQQSGRNKWSIDRINNNGNYEPSNCRWTTDDVQANNTRKSLPKELKYKTCAICGKEFKARSKCQVVCSKQCGLKHRKNVHQEKTKYMYKKECPICHKIFEDRSGHFKRSVHCSRKCSNLSKSPIWEFNGKKLRVLEWAKEIGINAHCLHHRKELGWSVEQILTTPKNGKRKIINNE